MEGRADFLKRNEFEGEIKVPNVKRKELPRERYKRRKIERQNQIRRRVKIGTGIAILSGAIVFGGVKTLKEHNDGKPITLEQALDIGGKTLDELGIDEDIKNRIESIEEELTNGNLKNKEIIELSSRIRLLQMDVIKSKLSALLNVSPNDIKLVPTEDDRLAHIDVNDVGTFKSKHDWNNIRY